MATRITLEELLESLDMEASVVAEYVELGLVAPADDEGPGAFSDADAARLARAQRLARDLELHAAAASLLLELLEERENLLRRVRSLEQALHRGG